MTRLGLLLGSVLLVAACFGGTTALSSTPALTSTPAPTATSVPTALPAPSPVPTIEPMPTAEGDPTNHPMWTYGPCPATSPLTVVQFVDADPACFGSTDIQIRGWLDGPPGIGWEPPGIEPGWVYYPAPSAPTIWNQKPTDPGDPCNADNPNCRWFLIHINPASHVDLGAMKRWIIVTGHVYDAAAETCHYVYPEGTADGTYDDSDAVAACRVQFVLVRFKAAP